MKKKILFVSLLICLALTGTAYAHPPKDIEISYDPATKILTAIILHDTSNPLGHYIKKVDVGLNDQEIIEQKISRQENINSQEVNYYIPDTKSGDRLSVEGYCSISGKLKKEIVVK
ncbi:MAG: hypothetical protein M0R17_10055 [Candidatus Omnitrophica bacterium]|jgi:hypothetical protein|nr:hypothetical protein [Candidatus Omnitrophota bacterium]MDD5252543.1 hypothetical protein [Candidatus Omnitrophota bacterium]